ncbi:unnamed protein product [Dicrocoelium dendriticum]|nr:unnamed protein product [Dicrocoelium dendriticum]
MLAFLFNPALFKDFLRELPEPLFTSALYPMFYDAMQVTLPGFSHNGAKLMLNILDCLPTINQEILLYLLDHFKRVTNQCVVNRMDTANLATCLAPVLFYPAPNSARNLDPAILEPSKMAEIFKFILDIWPDERTTVPPFESDVDVWRTELRRTRSPMLNEEFQADPQSAVYAPRRSHRRRHGQHRASSGTRSTLSGPASMGMRLDSPPQMQRTSHGYAGGHGGSGKR